MALNYVTSIFTGQSVFVEDTTAGAPTATAARGSIAIINVAGSVAVYINSSAGATGNTWTQIGATSASAISYDPTRSDLVQELTGAPAITVQQAIDAIASGQIVADFVFNPNLASDEGNRYATFASLYTAFSRVPDYVQKRITFIKANAGTTTIPVRAGGYNFRNTEFVGDPASGFPTPVDVADGAFIATSGNARLPWRIEGIVLDFLTTTVPFCDLTTGQNTIWLEKGSLLRSSGTVIPLQVNTAGSSFVFNLDTNCGLLSAGVSALVSLGVAGARSEVNSRDESDVNQNVLSAVAGAQWTVNAYGLFSSLNQTQLGAGAFIFNLNYTPFALADWSGIAPLSIQNALDRIAAAIGPIP